MDELKIRNDELKDFIARAITRYIRKKYGFDVEIHFTKDIEITIENAAHLSIGVDADISNYDLRQLRKNLIGL